MTRRADACRRCSHGGLETAPASYGAAREGSRLVECDPQETPIALTSVRDGSVPRAHLLRAAALLLDVVTGNAPDDPDARALGLERALRLVASLVAEAIGSAPPAAEPAWPGEPLTQSEARVLRYLPTHMSAPEIGAELYLSANTVKTHLRHLDRKPGAHSRLEAVQRARAIGLLAVSSGRR
jgi:LuxR family transcriptional regulator, maltose regulon positive regulatory protein